MPAGATISTSMGIAISPEYQLALNERTDKKLQKLWFDKTFLYGWMESRPAPYDAANKKLKITFENAIGRSGRATGERDAAPDAANPDFFQAWPTISQYTGTVEFTQLEMQMIGNGQMGEKAFLDIWDTRHEQAAQSMKEAMSRDAWRDGSGLMATVTTAYSGTDGTNIKITGPVGNFDWDPDMLLYEGDPVVAYSSGVAVTGMSETSKRRVQAIRRESDGTWSLDIVDIAGVDPSLAAGDTIYIQGTKLQDGAYMSTGSQCLKGFECFFADTAPTNDPYVDSSGASVSRTRYPKLKSLIMKPNSNTINASELFHNGKVTTALLRAIKRILGNRIGAGGVRAKPDTCFINDEMLDWVYSLYDNKRRFGKGDELTVDWPGDGIRQEGINYLASHEVPRGTMWWTRQADWKFYTLAPLGWATGGGVTPPFLRHPGYTTFQGVLFASGQPWCHRPGGNGLVTGLTGPGEE